MRNRSLTACKSKNSRAAESNNSRYFQDHITTINKSIKNELFVTNHSSGIFYRKKINMGIFFYHMCSIIVAICTNMA